MSGMKRRLAWQQMIGADALADLGDELRNMVDDEADRKMRELAESEGMTLDRAVSTKSSEPLVWIETKDGRQLVGVEVARAAGLEHPKPDVYLWRYENTASSS